MSSFSPPTLSPPSSSSAPSFAFRASSLPEPSTIVGSPMIPSTIASVPSTPIAEKQRPTAPSKKLSNPVGPAPLSVPITPSPHPQPLTDHLYSTFLHGTCADVRLWVSKWGVGWHVHKMVLVQAGFFHSLFLGGFSETTQGVKRSSGKGKERASDIEDDWMGEDVELHFDDPNITRAAFEICLSRLYSSHPRLQFPTSLLPTPSHPLTPSFPTATPSSFSSARAALPPNATLATPRLLLSLLATAIYLGHAPVMREVLSMVLRTVGPQTIGRYLGFAIGDGVGEEEWDGQHHEGARDLEGIGRPIRRKEEHIIEEIDESSDAGHPRIPIPSAHRGSADSDIKVDDDDSKVGGSAPTVTVTRSISGASNPTLRGLSLSQLGLQDDRSSAEILLPHFYGFASNKIGEACVCWLARWGVDLLDVEVARPAGHEPSFRVWAHRGLPASFVRALISSDSFFVKDEMERYRVAREVLDLRRRGWEVEMESRGDISASYESDGGTEEWDDDELEMAKTFEDLSIIAADIDPHTHLPYAPLQVLQAAHWSAADLKARVASRETAGALPPNDDAELGLAHPTSDIASAISRSRRPTARSRVSSPTNGSWTPSHSSSFSLGSASPRPSVSGLANTAYHPVPSDDTHRVGAGGIPFLNTQATASTPMGGIAGMPDLGPTSVLDEPEQTRGRPPPVPQGEKTFFGLLGGSRNGADIAASQSQSTSDIGFTFSGPAIRKDAKWSRIEPFRFSVEFWGVDKLAEKERLYSSTHFHAGTWWNVYVQTIRKKDKPTQLGIYLHRQNPAEPFPTASAPPTTSGNGGAAGGAGSGGVLRGREGSLDRVGDRLGSFSLNMSPSEVRAGLPGSQGSQASQASQASQGSQPSSVPQSRRVSGSGTDQKGPYEDTRRVTKAYFSISCASALGTALIRFSSAPDSFSLSQSWGWKSSALRSEEYLAVPFATEGEKSENGVLGWIGDVPEGRGEGAGEMGERGSLRATVMVGVI